MMHNKPNAADVNFLSAAFGFYGYRQDTFAL